MSFATKKDSVKISLKKNIKKIIIEILDIMLPNDIIKSLNKTVLISESINALKKGGVIYLQLKYGFKNVVEQEINIIYFLMYNGGLL